MVKLPAAALVPRLARALAPLLPRRFEFAPSRIMLAALVRIPPMGSCRVLLAKTRQVPLVRAPAEKLLVLPRLRAPPLRASAVPWLVKVLEDRLRLPLLASAEMSPWLMTLLVPPVTSW